VVEVVVVWVLELVWELVLAPEPEPVWELVLASVPVPELVLYKLPSVGALQILKASKCSPPKLLISCFSFKSS